MQARLEEQSKPVTDELLIVDQQNDDGVFLQHRELPALETGTHQPGSSMTTSTDAPTPRRKHSPRSSLAHARIRTSPAPSRAAPTPPAVGAGLASLVRLRR